MEHGGEGPALLVALEQSVLGATMRQSIFLYPAVEIVHIFGFILLVGSIVAFDLRLLGLIRELPADRLARLLVRLSTPRRAKTMHPARAGCRRPPPPTEAQAPARSPGAAAR